MDLKWKDFGFIRPADQTQIIWRELVDNEWVLGTGWYCEEDAQLWKPGDQWIAVTDLNQLPVEVV